ncbi:Uncharacterized protein dnm_098970 [Desulfonema magnum]|uniref:Uncharacterized protein n=1 Tax=Desulfonema magnum TaxID=45655 RepID=A0A975C0L2_9BACT|nr:Uncharacterized protein dnm_098970 [Desulfonema magnum]
MTSRMTLISRWICFVYFCWFMQEKIKEGRLLCKDFMELSPLTGGLSFILR